MGWPAPLAAICIRAGICRRIATLFAVASRQASRVLLDDPHDANPPWASSQPADACEANHAIHIRASYLEREIACRSACANTRCIEADRYDAPGCIPTESGRPLSANDDNGRPLPASI